MAELNSALRCQRDMMNIVCVVAGFMLLGFLSWEIIASDRVHFSNTYLVVQFIVCLLFLYDYALGWVTAQHRTSYFWRNIPYLAILIPWLNIFDWSNIAIPHYWGLLLGLMPLLRAFAAMILIVRWLISGSGVKRLMWAYIFTVFLFTYISALVFYDYEAGVNPKLDSFGNALWWAWMNVTTVGAAIFPVTAVGKVVCVLLPSLGMMFFPIFTSYVLQEYTHKKDGGE